MLYTQRTSQAILASLVAMLMLAGIAPVNIHAMDNNNPPVLSPHHAPHTAFTQSTNTSNASSPQMNALRQAEHMARCQQQQLPHSQAYSPLSSSSMLTDDQRTREQLMISIQQLATRARRTRTAEQSHNESGNTSESRDDDATSQSSKKRNLSQGGGTIQNNNAQQSSHLQTHSSSTFNTNELQQIPATLTHSMQYALHANTASLMCADGATHPHLAHAPQPTHHSFLTDYSTLSSYPTYLTNSVPYSLYPCASNGQQNTQILLDQTHAGASPLTHQPLTTMQLSDSGTQHHAENTAPTQGAELDNGDVHRIQADVAPTLPSSTDQSSASATQSDTERVNTLIAAIQGIETARKASEEDNKLIAESNAYTKSSAETKAAHAARSDNPSDTHHTCSPCNRNFLTKAALINHQKSNAHLKMLKNANANLATSTTECKETYTCTECKKTYQNKHTLIAHRNKHTTKFECKFCNYCAISNSALVRHEKIHTGEKPYKCRQCNKTFGDISSHKRHMMKCTANLQG